MSAETNHNIKLTSTELSALWTTYMNDTMAICVLSHFLKHIEDAEIKPVIEYALQLSNEHIQTVTEIFKNEDFPIPDGFGNQDVNLDAPRLFADTFYLHYLHQLGKIGLSAYGVALPTCARTDIRKFYNECVESSAELYEKTATVLLNKGLYARSPYIPNPDKVNYVEKQSFLTGWFGNRRPLNAVEVSHLYINIQTNTVGKALFIGFSQVAQSKQVRKQMERGSQIAGKHIEVFSSLLSENNLPSPETWDHLVHTSNAQTFSDKLIMFHTSLMCTAEIGNYGAAIGGSMRRDLSTQYTRLLGEIGLFAEDTVNIMIDNAWLEQIPLTADRHKIAEK